MNYYEHHIGDYAEATQHLSILEDGVYSRLLRKYYASEKALPADLSAVNRLVVAKSKDERAAVDVVLKEFFVLEEDGWHQPRCDIEIQRFRAGEPEREAKKSNEQIRMRRHREERAKLFAQLNAAGESALWNLPIKDLRELVAALPQRVAGQPTDTAPETAEALQSRSPETPTETAPATPATATQTPDTIPRHQTPTNNLDTPLPPKGVPVTRRSPEFAEAAEKTEGFNAFYAMYPKKDKGPDALKAWRQMKLHERIDDRLAAMSGLAKWLRHPDWAKEEGRFIPLPATWLRNMRWLDSAIVSQPENRELVL